VAGNYRYEIVMKIFFALLTALTLSVISIPAKAAAGCEGTLPAGAERAIDTARPDIVLFSAAVRYYANIERCSRGLPPFGPDPQLRSAALGHSLFMARANTMTHVSNISGRRTLQERMRASQVSMRTAGENVAQNFVFAIGGRSISTARRGTCGFTYADTGQPVPAHSYASLAQEQVARWMASPGHRKNLLNGRFNRVETALAYAPDKATCGRIYMTQNFAG